MRSVQLAFLVVVGLLLASCDGLPGTPQAEAIGAIRARLIEPGSGKFEVLAVKGRIVCGTVNARNRMGGYTGKSLFIYDPSNIMRPVMLYDEPPSDLDYSLWSGGGSGREEYYEKLESGCSFPDEWRSSCAASGVISIPTNERLCAAWKKKDFQALSDMAHGY